MRGRYNRDKTDAHTEKSLLAAAAITTYYVHGTWLN